MPKMGGLKWLKKVFALYLLQTKRFGRSGKLIENGGPNCTNKHQNWSLWRPRFDFLRFWWIWASFLFFFCIFECWQKAIPKIQNIRFLAKGEVQKMIVIIQVWPLSSGSGHFIWFYISLSDNAWHQPVSADFGARWILKGSPNRSFSHKINIKLEKRMCWTVSWNIIFCWMDFWGQNGRPW